MDKIIQVLKSWIDINLTELKTGRLPHVSFIIDRIITHPTSRGLIKHLSGYEVVKIGYILFHMYEGKTLEEAKEIAENIHTVHVVEITDIGDEMEDCEVCYSDGTIECPTCDGDTTIDCHECDGDPDSIEGGCDYCDETGKMDCDECYGDGALECYECGGDGQIMSGYEYVEFDEGIWLFTNDELYKTYKAKMDGDIQNIDFYEESDEHAGDLWLYKNTRDGMRLDDFNSVNMIEKPEDGESIVVDLDEDIPSGLKNMMSIKKFGNSGRDYRII